MDKQVKQEVQKQVILNMKHEWKYAQQGDTNCHKRTTVEDEGMKSSQ